MKSSISGKGAKAWHRANRGSWRSLSACCMGWVSRARWPKSVCRRMSIPLALLFFNIGVEIGQVLFILAVLAIYRALSKLLAGRFDLTRLAPVQAYAIGGLASYWLFERVSGFWS